MLAAASWAGVRTRFLYVVLAVFLFWFIGVQISLYFLIWLAGALVGRLHRVEWLGIPRVLAFVSMAAGLLFFGVLAWNRAYPIAFGDAC